jgi:hypothetical protein
MFDTKRLLKLASAEVLRIEEEKMAELKKNQEPPKASIFSCFKKTPEKDLSKSEQL